MGDTMNAVDVEKVVDGKSRDKRLDQSRDPDADTCTEITTTSESQSKPRSDGSVRTVKSSTVKDVTPAVDQFDHPFSHSNDTSDLRLLVEGKPLYVSRVVLSLVSPVLKSLLSMKGSEDTVELSMSGKKYTHMVQFLCCVYPDILASITDVNVEVVLDLADEFQVLRLVERCEDFLVSDVANTSPPPHPEKIVRYLALAEKYELGKLQIATYEAAAKTPSDLLESVQAFWDLPSVTTTSVFIRRLKLLEKCGKTIRCKLKEVQNHCALYHKVDKTDDNMCMKCYAQIGKYASGELRYI